MKNNRTRKGIPYSKIKISEKHAGEDHRIRPLTKPEVKARLDWYGAMIPLYNHNTLWFRFACKRMDELNALLSGTHSVRHGVSI